MNENDKPTCGRAKICCLSRKELWIRPFRGLFSGNQQSFLASKRRNNRNIRRLGKIEKDNPLTATSETVKIRNLQEHPTPVTKNQVTKPSSVTVNADRQEFDQRLELLHNLLNIS